MKTAIKSYWKREDGFAATTTALILGSVAIAGALTSAYGAYSSGQAQKAAGDFNQKIAQNNALAAEQQSAADAAKVRDKNNRLRGMQIAGFAKAGTSATGGSAGDVEYDSAVQGELDALTTLYRGSVEGSNYRSKGELSEMEGNSAATAGIFNAGGTLLSGAAQGYMNYTTIKNNPNF